MKKGQTNSNYEPVDSEEIPEDETLELKMNNVGAAQEEIPEDDTVALKMHDFLFENHNKAAGLTHKKMFLEKSSEPFSKATTSRNDYDKNLAHNDHMDLCDLDDSMVFSDSTRRGDREAVDD